MTHRPTIETNRVPAATLREEVFRFIMSCGEYGATDEETAFALGMGGNTQRPRRIELIEEGRVRDSGQLRKTSSGRNATVWIAKGLQKTAVLEFDQ